MTSLSITKVQQVYRTSESKETMISELLVSQFRRLHISYSQAYNKLHRRTGNLINRPFKRSLFDPDVKFGYLPYHIHHNGRKHGVVKSFEDYPHQSYAEIVKEESEILDTSEIIDRFGSIEKFVEFHRGTHYKDKFEELIIED